LPIKSNIRRLIVALHLVTLALVACTSTVTPIQGIPAATTPPGDPDWFSYQMTDARTGQTFTINEYAGKVVLLETMAQWCPTCELQENEVKKLHQMLGNPQDLVSISLDVDLHEDEASLKQYAEKLGYDWIFAVAPLEVARALGNMYSAQYLNPPVSPMLIIDQNGDVYGLPYGLKSAESLKKNN
jgi:thiol-disulfide isomerase/thioredoxin